MANRVEVTPLPSSRGFIAGLDGIRALAVLTVFLFHAQILPHVPGELATTTFFFLSGFLITTLFVKEFRKTGDVSLKGFYYRRTLRTIPPLLIALGVAFLVHALLHVGDALVAWKTAGNFLNYTNYALAFSLDNKGFLPGTVLLWSLAVDEHYYMFFAPAFRAAVKRMPLEKIAWAILALCGAALLSRIWLVHEAGYVNWRVTMASDTRMDSILFGSFLALWRNPALEPERARGLAKPIWITLAVIGLSYVDLSRNWFITGTIGYTIQGLALIPIFSLAILQGGKGRLKFLQSPILMWVSRASYPLYLLQWIMIMVCEKYIPGPRLGQMPVAFVLTVGLGAAMHYSVELPLARLRKRSKAKASGHAASPPMELEPARA